MGPGFILPTIDGHALFFLVTVSPLASGKGSVDLTAFDHLNSIHYLWMARIRAVFSFRAVSNSVFGYSRRGRSKARKKRKCPFLLMG